MTENVNILKQVAALPGLSPANLKKKWRELFDADPPKYDKNFLVKGLAHRLQELAYGGLPQQTSGELKTIAQYEARTGHTPTKRDSMPVVGTQLFREWKGERHCVTVQASGFEYQGRPFRSLSAVAKAITGTQWNGWLFFGVRRQNSEVAQ